MKTRRPPKSATSEKRRYKDKTAPKKCGRQAESASVQIAGIDFARDGANVAVQFHANDNKDRWIATVDLANMQSCRSIALNDPAWINWNFNEFGWEHDNNTLWYVSEETGYAQLYAKPPGGSGAALTQRQVSKFRSRSFQRTATGFTCCANAEAPYAYDIYRVPVAGGASAACDPLPGRWNDSHCRPTACQPSRHSFVAAMFRRS